jgi:hypothetical protein
VAETWLGPRQQMQVARRQHKALARAAATRIEHYAKQVLSDLDHDRPVTTHGRQIGVEVLQLLIELTAIQGLDELEAKLRPEVAALSGRRIPWIP